MQIEDTILKNKIRTLFINLPGSNAASVQVWFRAGSALEKDDHLGIAHFLEHMFFKGTPSRPGAAIAHEVESFGGEINAFTSFDYTCYYVNTPNDHLNQTINILMDMVSNPQFLNEELIPEREVVMEEYNRSQDNPIQFAFSELQTSCFKSGYKHPILGNRKTIGNFSRQQLIDFRNRFYNLSNSMLVVAGDLNNKKQLTETIEKYTMPEGDKSNFPKFKLSSTSKMNIHKREVRQALLTLTIEAPDYSDDHAPVEDLAISCLAHGETSRLYQRLVHDTSLASSVGGSTMFFANGGSHFIRVACPVENLSKILREFSTVMKDLFSNNFKNGFSNAEVQKIKNQYVSSKVYEKESVESYAFSLGHGFAQNGDIHCEDIFIEKMKKVSAKCVNQRINTILGRPIHISVQLPQKDKTSSDQINKMLKNFRTTISGLTQKLIQDRGVKFATSNYDPQAKLIKLKNGIKLIYRQNTMTPTSVFHCYIKGGLTEENKQNNGIYHLIGSTLTKGHHKIPYEKIKNSLEDKNAYISGFTGKNAYGLTMHSQTEHWSELLYHFFGALLHPDIPTKRLTHEKELTLRALENGKEDPVKICFTTFSEIIFNGHPYSLEILGTPSTLKKHTATQIKELHNKNVKNKEMLFTYCGDLDLEEVIDLLKPYIEKLPARKTSKALIKKIKQGSGQKQTIDLNREQTHIFIGRSGNKLGAAHDLYLKILTAYLSGQSSDLFVNIRDKMALCYSVQAVHFTALEAGYWGIYIGTANDKKDKAIEAIIGLLNQLQQNGISANELKRVKTMIKGQSQINIQTNEDYANIYSVPELHSLGMDYHYKNQDKIDQITVEEYNKFLASFLKTKWNVVSVGKVNK